jgi:hypothetical protein
MFLEIGYNILFFRNILIFASFMKMCINKMNKLLKLMVFYCIKFDDLDCGLVDEFVFSGEMVVDDSIIKKIIMKIVSVENRLIKPEPILQTNYCIHDDDDTYNKKKDVGDIGDIVKRKR